MQSVREIVQKEIRPRETDLDETGQFPWETVRILAENDILNGLLPRRYGGPEVSFFTFSMIIEEISKGSASSALLLITQAEGILPIALGANESLKEKYLSRLAGASRVLTGMGGINPSLHLSPVSSGIRADLLGEKYLLNGKRCFIRNGSIADFLVLYACTAPSEEGKGVNAFVVEKGNPGLVLRRDENRMGMRGSIYSEMDIENLEVPGENRIDSEGEGFSNMMKTLSLGRLFTAAQAVGLAKGAMDEAISYARKRIQFGKPVSHHGQIQLMIADMATGIESARLLSLPNSHAVRSGRMEEGRNGFSHGQTHGLGYGHEGCHRCGPDHGGLRLYERLSGGTDDARCQAHPDRFRNQSDDEINHRKGINRDFLIIIRQRRKNLWISA